VQSAGLLGCWWRTGALQQSVSALTKAVTLPRGIPGCCAICIRRCTASAGCGGTAGARCCQGGARRPLAKATAERARCDVA
jgi:hypothetical protein